MKLKYHAPIRKTHPTLFRLIATLAIVNIVVSMFLLFGDAQSLINFNKFPDEGIFPPLAFYAALWLLAAYWLLLGLTGGGNYKWARRGLTLSSMIGGFWAFGFTASFFTEAVLGISAPILWSMYAALCVILTNEPVINPLAAAIQNNFTNGSHVSSIKDTTRAMRIRDHG